MSARKFWTNKEVKTLHSLAGTMSIKDIAERMGRSLISVKSRAEIEGLATYFHNEPQINKKNVACILEMISNTSLSNVARIMQMTEHQLMSQVNKATS